jgi:hypothetical protein
MNPPPRSHPDSEGTSKAPLGTRVRIARFDGSEIPGTIQTFNPRLPTFVLHTDANPTRIAFEDVKTVAFLRADTPPTPHSGFSIRAQLVTVGFRDQTTLRGVAENFGGPRSGLFLIPTAGDSIDRIYVPASAIREVVSIQRLEELFPQQTRVTREMVHGAAPPMQELASQTPTSPRPRASDRVAPQTPLPSPQSRPPTRIGDILVEQGFLTHEELESALLASKRQPQAKLGELLIEMGYASYKMIAIALAMQYSRPFASLSGHCVEASLRDLLHRDEALRWQLLPLRLEQGVLTVAIADPARIEGLETLQQRSGAVIRTVVSTPQDIQHCILALFYPDANQAS